MKLDKFNEIRCCKDKTFSQKRPGNHKHCCQSGARLSPNRAKQGPKVVRNGARIGIRNDFGAWTLEKSASVNRFTRFWLILELLLGHFGAPNEAKIEAKSSLEICWIPTSIFCDYWTVFGRLGTLKSFKNHCFYIISLRSHFFEKVWFLITCWSHFGSKTLSKWAPSGLRDR